VNREDILRMAHEADCLDTQHYGSVWADRLLRFAILIAATEREECALAALDAPIKTSRQDTREACAAAIRARGQA
jgi:hypothetical protein